MFRKNVATQFIHFQGVDSSTGGIKSGVSWTIRRCIDGTFAAGGGTVTEDGTTGWYKYAMSQADTNGNNIGFNFTGTGAVPQTVNIVTTAADPTDSVRLGLTGLANAVPGASGGLLISGSNSGTTTLAALTITGSTTMSDGLLVSRSTSNVSAITATGNGTGSGIVATSGGGATGDGIQATSVATNGNGLVGTGIGTGNGIKAASVSGAAISAVASTSGDGITATGAGTTKHGINASGGATTSHGISATGGGVGHGILATSGAGATGNGITATAQSTNGSGMTLVKTGSGSDLNATVTPLVLAKTTNLTGLNDIAATAVVSAGAITTSSGKVSGVILTDTVTTYTGNTPQTGDTFALANGASGFVATKADTAAILIDTAEIGTAGAGLTNIDLPNQTMNITGDITGNLSGSVGSVTGAAGSVTGAVGSVTGNVIGSVGSIASGGITAGSFGAGAINAAAIAADAVTEIRSLASGTSDSGSTTTMVDAARTEADTDYWKGQILVFTSGNIAGQSRVITAFNAATDTITFAPATTQTVDTQTYEIWPVGDFLRPTTSGNTLDVSTGGEAGLDWANIGSPTTAQNLSATNIDVDQVVASVSGAVASVTGNVGGNVVGSVASVTGAVGSVTGNVGGNITGSVASVIGIAAKKNTALATFEFVMNDSTNHSPATGLTVAATRSIDGGAFASCANSVTEIANGWYKIDLAASDLNGNVIGLRFTAAGADTANLTILTNA